MPPRIALALKINCVRMAGFAGQREVPVTSSFAIHMCSSERVFHNPYAFFPSLVFYFSSCLSYCSLGFRRFSIVGLYFPTSTIGITTISYKKSINKLYYNSLNQNGTPCLYLQSKSNHMQDYLLLVFWVIATCFISNVLKLSFGLCIFFSLIVKSGHSSSS